MAQLKFDANSATSSMSLFHGQAHLSSLHLKCQSHRHGITDFSQILDFVLRLFLGCLDLSADSLVNLLRLDAANESCAHKHAENYPNSDPIDKSGCGCFFAVLAIAIVIVAIVVSVALVVSLSMSPGC